MSNSPLVVYTKISPCSSPRNNNNYYNKIDTITIHHMAGNMTVESCGKLFQDEKRQVSSNYGIGSDGRIAMYVEEKNRSWCSSSRVNDYRAITIEVANDGGANTGWHVSDKALASLVQLCADICKRNGIAKLVWSDSKDDRVNHKNGCNMTVHQDFVAKTCPGPYLLGKHQWIADQVNAILQPKAEPTKPVEPTKPAEPVKPVEPAKPAEPRTIKKGCTGDDVKTLQTNLNKVLGISLAVDGDCGQKTDEAIRQFQTKFGLVVDGSFGPASRAKMTEVLNTPAPTPAPTTSKFTVGQEVQLISGATYADGKSIPSWVFTSKLYVRAINGNKVTVSTLQTGAITGIVLDSSLKVYSAPTPAPTPAPSAFPYTVKTKCGMNVRAGAGTNYAVVGSVGSGKFVTVYAKSGNWGKISASQNKWMNISDQFATKV